MSEKKKKGFFERMGLVEVTEDSKKDEPVQTNSTEAPTSLSRRLPDIQTQEETPQSFASTNWSAPTASSITPTNVPQDVKDKFFVHFDSLLQNSGIPAPNYYTFSKMLIGMGNLPDSSKFPGAYGALSAMGLRKDSLLSSGNQFIGLLNDDAKTFAQSMQNKIQETKNKVQEINNKMNQDEAQIKQIELDTQAEILKLQQDADKRIGMLRVGITNAKTQITPLEQEVHKVNTSMDNYNAVSNQYKEIISNDLNNITRYIQ